MKKIISLLVISFISTLVYAEKPLNFIFFEDLSYDDNIYYTKENKISSAISSTQLIAKYLNNIPNSGLKFGTNINLGYNAYTENSDKNNYINAGLELNLKNDKFCIEENFLYTADPATSELTDRAKRINNLASFRFKTSLEKMFSIGLVISDIFDKYEDDTYKSLNRNRINAGMQLYYNLSPKTSIYLGYLFSKIDYENNDLNNSLGNSVNLGINGTLSSKIKGTAQISYDMRNYEKDIENTNSNADIVGYLLSLKYEPTLKNSLSLTGERKMEEATFENNRYYVSTEIGVEYRHTIYKKWTTILFASYENIKYPETSHNNIDRVDNLVKIKPSIEYKFKDYLFASIWYQFRDKFSNYDVVEFSNNKFGAQVKLCF